MIVILGAGLAGLSTAYHLLRAGCRALALYEREVRPGGLCRSETRDGFTFDRTGHFLHLRSPEVERMADEWLGPQLARVARSSWIWSHGVFTRYPFQTHTYGLPVEVVKEVLLGYIEARYAKPRDWRLRIADCGLKSEVRNPKPEMPIPMPGPRRSFERWVYETFGAGIAKHFMIPYNDKLWGVHPRHLTTEWMGRYVPPASLEQVIEGALSDKAAGEGYNAFFRYPRRGGIETLVRALVAQIGDTRVSRRGAERAEKKEDGLAIRDPRSAIGNRQFLKVGCEAVAVDIRRRRVEFADGSRADYEALVSTLPLPELLRRVRALPAGIAAAGARLRWSSVFAVNLGVRPDATSGRHWVYVPEPRFPFYRVGCFSNAARSMAPRGRAAVWAEVSYNERRPIDRAAARRQVIEGLREMGWLHSPRDIEAEWLLDIPYAYVTYDAHHRQATRRVLGWLERHGVFSIGRYGRWEYSSMEDALLQGAATARRLLEPASSRKGL